MRPINPMSIIPKYAKDSTYIDGPTPAQQEAGMIPLDTVPADWWNKLFQQLSEQVNNACNGMATAYDEILNVLSAANIQPDATQNDQLARAITNLRQTVANAANAGAVKSSATSGKVSVDANGIMTPNGMGVPTALNTTTKEIVSAINELKSAYDQAIQSINSSISALNSGKAPSYHASAETTYGVGNGTQYGHLKISGAYLTSVGDAGVAASQDALHAAYNSLVNLIGQSSQLPRGLSPAPVFSLTTLNGTATFHVTHPGFYYVFVAGANGGAGGRTKASNSVGGAGGRGEQIGQILYLMPGDYVCRTGGNGGAGAYGYGSAGGSAGPGYHYGNPGQQSSGSYNGAGGGGGGGSSAFYRSSAPVLLIEACGGGGGGGGGGTDSGPYGGYGGYGGGPGYSSGGSPGAPGRPYSAGDPGFSYPQLVGSISNACIHIHECV